MPLGLIEQIENKTTMSKQRRTIHTSRTRRRDTDDIPCSVSVVSSVVSNASLHSRTSSIIPLPPNIIAYPSSAAAIILLFTLVSLAQISSIFHSSEASNNFSSLRRSLQSEHQSKLSTEFIIPIADRATNRDVAILWHDVDDPLAPSVNSYYQCIGKTVTGKLAGYPEHEIKDDWNDSMIKLALLPQDISGLVKSGEVNDLMVMASRPSTASRLYLSEKQRGRMLGLFRHPVDVASGHFTKLKSSHVDRMTFIENMDSDVMVKKIVGLNPSDAVSVADLKVAMDFIRDYVVVGLTSEMEESLRRFNLAMGMDERQNSNCTNHSGLLSQHQEHGAIARNSPEWLAITQKSPLDTLLYSFVEKLYEQQYEIFDIYSEMEQLSDQVIQWSDVYNSTHLAAFDAPFTRNERQTPFFWHIPRSGGSSIQDLYWCMDYTLANQVGGEPRFHKIVPRHILMEFQPWKEHGIANRVLNVDMTTRNGIVHAKNLGLFSVKQVPKPDLIYSTQFYALSTILFSSRHNARLFSLFRHPVDRAVSRFRSLQKTNKAWADLSVNDWAIQDNQEANWMVRELVGKGQDDDLGIKDLDAAKVIVRDKFIVGLTNKYQESLRRFNILMGVDQDSKKAKTCMESHPDVPQESTKLEQGNLAYVTLMSVNFLDVMLYQYVEVLFDSQARLFQSAVS
eukprot:scaffold2132_cov66-Cyclotella_meneghiniana.AAC.1